MWTHENRAKYNRDHLRYPRDLTDDEWTLDFTLRRLFGELEERGFKVYDYKKSRLGEVEDQSAKPEERHAADPDGLHCGSQGRTDLRFAIEGHEDEAQVQKQA